MELILGIDDAGRGPVIGPMVLAGCLVNKDTENKFVRMGIRDSKMLAPKKREAFAEEIKKSAFAFYEVLVSVDEIDGKRADNLNLNQREAVAAAQIINKLNKGKDKIQVIIDCPSTNIPAWKEYLEKFLIAKTNLSVLCAHKADVNYVVVSAASILAKTRRDAEVKKLKEKLGVDFGSGYSSDPNTKKFIPKTLQSGLCLPLQII